MSARPSALVLVACLAAGAALTAHAAPVYRAFGDSITFGEYDETGGGGYPPRLQTKLRQRGQPGAVVVNHGMNGENTSQGVSRIASVLAQGADVILLMEGTNDVFARVSTETINFNLNEMARKALAAGVQPLVATLIPNPPWATRDPSNARTGAVAVAVRDLTLDRRRLFADPYTIFLNTPNVYALYYAASSMSVGHPNGAGYDYLAEVFANAILAPRPRGKISLDSPERNGRNGLPLLARGWAIDTDAASGTGISSVRLRIFQGTGPGVELGTAALGFPRADIGATYGPNFLPSGFGLAVRPLFAPGNYTMLAEGASTVAPPGPAHEVAFTVPPGDVLLTAIDSPSAGSHADPPLDVSGRCTDPTSPAGTDQVEVWLLPNCGNLPSAMAIAELGQLREEYPQGTGQGLLAPSFVAHFGAVPEGLYSVLAAPRSAMTGNIDAATQTTVHVRDAGPLSAPSLLPRYRLYLDATHEHLYTTDPNEYTVLQTRGWLGEGVSHQVLSGAGDYGGVTPVPFYRFYHPGILQHFWTTGVAEACALAASGSWIFEGKDGYLLPVPITGSIPLYRLAYAYGPYHLWTTDVNEYTVLPSFGWIQEGIVGDVLP